MDNPAHCARDRIFERSDEVLGQAVDDETVLLDLVSEKYFSINPVGTRIWQLLGDGVSLDALLRTLLHEFETEPAQLEQDVREFLGALQAAGLVRLRSEAGGS
jgi:hypothetical protein